jgi:hypothetical protein
VLHVYGERDWRGFLIKSGSQVRIPERGTSREDVLEKLAAALKKRIPLAGGTLLVSRAQNQDCALRQPFVVCGATKGGRKSTTPTADGIHREVTRGVQNTSSDFTNDSISFWWSGIPTTYMS